MRFVYHDRYDLSLGGHVFPSRKYRLLRGRLLEEAIAGPDDFLEPQIAADEDMLRVHTSDWVRRLKTGTLSYMEILRLEIPYASPTIEAFWWATGGTILACQLAVADGIGYNIGGGFHHAFAGHGEGFCAINDIAVAIRRLQHDGTIQKAMVVDCDNHHGNGTATIFAADPTVFTLSIHQFHNYPEEKPPSNLDIHLEDGTGDAEYLERLDAGLEPSLAESKPDLVVYVAGADPYQMDQLGGLNLTIDGLARRDQLVMESARRHGAAVAVVLAGGYAVSIDDTVTIHVNTAKVARQLLGP